MIAAFPVNPPAEGSHALHYANLLEPSAEFAAEEPGMDIDIPLSHPQMVMKLKLPTPVYIEETDEVTMELQPFHFPYTGKVRSCCFKCLTNLTHIMHLDSTGLPLPEDHQVQFIVVMFAFL